MTYKNLFGIWLLLGCSVVWGMRQPPLEKAEIDSFSVEYNRWQRLAAQLEGAINRITRLPRIIGSCAIVLTVPLAVSKTLGHFSPTMSLGNLAKVGPLAGIAVLSCCVAVPCVIVYKKFLRFAATYHPAVVAAKREKEEFERQIEDRYGKGRTLTLILNERCAQRNGGKSTSSHRLI